MKTLTKELWMDIPQRRQIVSIHEDDVEYLVDGSGEQNRLIRVTINKRVPGSARC
ncbi:hypothetical protein Pan241w_00980 [Gimesia alba]|uniref:Uncharacterized protein n=1 Tax=Gimesia alba TaxID=2527973 RepID=A0A517R853_9PLAN|nr:hypothetical protein [Gimesia alba]QDT40045.1 hypothetical protein Pan241w_00980 [Gimesia alba]